MNKIILFFLMLGASVFGAQKMYIDSTKLDMQTNEIYLDMGNNELMKVKNVHSNKKGIYILESEVECNKKEWIKHWKCPYCHRNYPEGQPCTNTSCPSRY